MTFDPKARACNLAEARRAAQCGSRSDVEALVEPCPASQPHIFVVPVRYALAEDVYSHRSCRTGEPRASHATAARRLRSGFVYVWHHQGPLKRYAVAADGLLLEQPFSAPSAHVSTGELTGLALDKHEEAWMCFTEHPLGMPQCQALGERSAREQHMRHLDLRLIANTLEAPHCPPLDVAEQVIGELMPEVYQRALAVDYKRNGEGYRKGASELGDRMARDPSNDNINNYTTAMRWQREREDASAQQPDINAQTPAPGEWSAERWDAVQVKQWLERAVQQAGDLYPVFACLDDELGILRDINHEQEHVQARHEQWLQDHGLRLQVGGFVRSLIQESGSELAGMLRYRYREQDLHLTDAQGETLLKAHHTLDEIFKRESAINQERGRTYSNAQADLKLGSLGNERADCLNPVRGFIPASLHNEIEAVVRDYRAGKVTSLNGWNGHNVEAYVDLEAMNTWMDQTAPAHFEAVQTRQALLFQDRARSLYAHHEATWFVDFDDIATRRWLDELALACLSAQCLDQQGARQYADYVQGQDPGALRQLIYAWTPDLEAVLMNTSRAGELMAALGLENREQVVQALSKVLAPVSGVVMADIARMAGPVETYWSLLLKRLGAALLLLDAAPADGLSPAWSSVLLAVRLSTDSAVRWVVEGGQRVLRFVGGAGEALHAWTQRTGQAIAKGRVGAITNSPIVQNSGGVLPLAVMLLNLVNARNYLGQVQVVDQPDKQRVYDTASAVLYAGAAVTAVVDVQVRKGLGIEKYILRYSVIPIMTFFGGILGGMSGAAALSELSSLQTQIERSESSVDPWLNMRKDVVGGLSVVYGLQAIVGASYTFAAMSGIISAEAAIAGYMLWMGPISLLIAGLGVLYLVTWLFQQKPLQNFLANCCWSKIRSQKLEPIPIELQRAEVERLYRIIYAPRVSFQCANQRVPSPNSISGLSYVSVLESITLDLPGAEPENVQLEMAMIGYSVDQEELDGQRAGMVRTTREPPRKWLDVMPSWLSKSQCTWIPYEEGQGLRLEGRFNIASRVWSNPTKVSLRIRYKTPLAALLGEAHFIGGENGIAFTVDYDEGVINLRQETATSLDTAKNYVLANGVQCSPHVQPGTRNE